MEKFKALLKNNLYIVSTTLLLIIFMQTCRINSNVKDVEKNVANVEININNNVDEKTTNIKNDIIKEIKIEGLKTEKRMIQSTDRKMLDVNRQSEIDREIDLMMSKN